MNYIIYNSGYKYQLKETYTITIDIFPEESIYTLYLDLLQNGTLIIKKGYAWDGPSGPTIDTSTFMRGSLVHDALYQLMREKNLEHDLYREKADSLLRKICKEDGMWFVRAWWVYLGVKYFGSPAADPAKRTPPCKSSKNKIVYLKYAIE